GTVTISASAADNIGVAGVRFFVDGTPIGAEDTSAPYAVAWNTASVADGSHPLTVVARDAAGNTTTSAAVSVTVDKTPPTVAITSPSAGTAVKGTITVSASAADNIGVAGVQFLVDGAPLGAENTSAPYAVAWNTAGVADGSHTLTAIARDAAGNTVTSAAVNVTVDKTPPTVAITSPSAGTAVKGTITVSANAADNI